MPVGCATPRAQHAAQSVVASTDPAFGREDPFLLIDIVI
jgi:hypothetical protein